MDTIEDRAMSLDLCYGRKRVSSRRNSDIYVRCGGDCKAVHAWDCVEQLGYMLGIRLKFGRQRRERKGGGRDDREEGFRGE